MKRIILAAAICAPLALTACEPAGNDPGPGGVTVDEAAALDEAAEMIEAKRLPEGTLPSTDAQNDQTEDTQAGETAAAENGE